MQTSIPEETGIRRSGAARAAARGGGSAAGDPGAEVDAVVVGPADGKRIFTLGGMDEGYRTFVESMRQGAVTVAREGTILVCEPVFCGDGGSAGGEGDRFVDF